VVSRPVQSEVVRKFSGSTGLGIYPSATEVTDCVEMDCINLGKKFIDRIESNWQNTKLNFVLQHKAYLGYTAMLYTSL